RRSHPAPARRVRPSREAPPWRPSSQPPAARRSGAARLAPCPRTAGARAGSRGAPPSSWRGRPSSSPPRPCSRRRPSPTVQGVAIGIAVVAAFFLASLPFLIPTTIWLALTVYAIVKGAGSAPEQADPAVVLLTIVGIVSFFTVAIAAAIALIGRGMTPKKRPRDELAAFDG